jgi:hypothetical protein
MPGATSLRRDGAARAWFRDIRRSPVACDRSADSLDWDPGLPLEDRNSHRRSWADAWMLRLRRRRRSRRDARPSATPQRPAPGREEILRVESGRHSIEVLHASDEKSCAHQQHGSEAHFDGDEGLSHAIPDAARGSAHCLRCSRGQSGSRLAEGGNELAAPSSRCRFGRNPFPSALVSSVVEQRPSQNAKAGQTVVQPALPGVTASVHGTGSFATGQSYTGVQLDRFLSRFVLNQPVGRDVSSGMSNTRSL